MDPHLQKSTRMMLVRVRVKGILQDLLKNTNVDTMPVPLVIFISDLLKPKVFVPNNFLSGYQMARVDTDNYGAFIRLDLN